MCTIIARRNIVLFSSASGNVGTQGDCLRRLTSNFFGIAGMPRALQVCSVSLPAGQITKLTSGYVRGLSGTSLQDASTRLHESIIGFASSGFTSEDMLSNKIYETGFSLQPSFRGFSQLAGRFNLNVSPRGCSMTTLLCVSRGKCTKVITTSGIRPFDCRCRFERLTRGLKSDVETQVGTPLSTRSFNCTTLRGRTGRVTTSLLRSRFRVASKRFELNTQVDQAREVRVSRPVSCPRRRGANKLPRARCERRTPRRQVSSDRQRIGRTTSVAPRGGRGGRLVL